MSVSAAQVEDRLYQWGGGVVVLDHACLRPSGDQVVNGIALAVLHEAQVADAPFRNADEAVPEGRGVKAIADSQPGSPRLVLTGRHCFRADEEVMQPTQA